MTIVCGTDLSDHAAQAVRVAAAMAVRLGEPLELVHAVEEPHAAFLLGSAPSSGDTPLRAALRREAEALRAKGVEVEELALVGPADEVLVDVARRVQAGLLVVASLGSRTEDRWRLGSVAERTVQTSPIPVLVVRELAPFDAWIRGERRLRVMVGANQSTLSKAAIRWLGELRRVGPCDIVVVRIAWPVDEHVRLDIPFPIAAEGLHPEIERRLLRDLRAWTGGIPGEGELSFLVPAAQGHLEDQLTTLAREAKVDLLVVGTHQRTGLNRLWNGSVSRGVLQRAPMSVACVPAAEPIVETSIPRLRRVIATTDFSPLASRAIPLAYALVADGGVVHLVHAIVDPEDLKDDPGGKLRAYIPPSAAARGIETKVEVLTVLDVALGICRAAERLGVDALCMGTHGRSGLSRWVVGSVAQEVLRRTRRPVFLVPPERDD